MNKLTIKLVKAAIARQNEYIEACKDSKNPQVIEMRAAAQSKKETYEAILRAMRGDTVFIRIDAGF